MIRPLLLASLVLAAAPVAAQETQASAAAKFRREFVATDTNKDGVWSLAEVQARAGNMRFAGPKTDPATVKRLSALWFARADANGNGKVTEYEAQALLAATFRRYDANKDGRIGTAERSAAKKAVEKER